MSNKAIIKIGHRGAKGYIAENTLESFAKAMELGIDAIELDVQVCKSGELVVFHDHRVERLTNGIGRIEDLEYKYLKKLDAGNGAIIPTLEQVLDLIDNKVIVNIELKSKNSAKEVAKLTELYINKHNWKKTNFLISSFDHIELLQFKKLSPEINIGALTASIPTNYALFAENLGAYSINISLEFTNQAYVDDAHKRGLKVFVYTVNHPKDIAICKAMGVDGIFSDFPDRL